MEKTREPGGLPSVIGGLLDFSKACLSKTGTRHKSNPPDERKEALPMYVTYSDLIQIGIFICALLDCVIQFSRENENSRHYCNNDGC